MNAIPRIKPVPRIAPRPPVKRPVPVVVAPRPLVGFAALWAA